MSSGGPVATAFVKVVPDATAFRAELQAAVNAAVRGVTVPPIGPGGAGAGGGAGGAGAATRAAANTKALTNESNALRGSLIGLSRVTPVTVFGLGLYGTAALAAGTAIKSAISSTADFEHQLYVFQATTKASGVEMQKVSELAIQLGNDLTLPGTSAGDAALAMTELSKAGLDVTDTLDAARGVLQLAAAAQLGAGEAAQFVATELNAFGLAGKEASHVADLLAGASIAAQGDIRDFAIAFQQVSAVAHQVRLPIEETTGALVGLAKAGLKGADGGTSLRTMLLRLAPTTKQAAEYQKALGIEIDKNVSIGKQLPQLLDQYKAALQALTPVQQQQALAQIFGQDAIRAASIAIEGGSAALRENTEAANQNGAANRLAEANAKGLTGAFNGLKNAADTFGITLGNVVKGPMTDFVSQAAQVVGAASDIFAALTGQKPKKGGGTGRGVTDFFPFAGAGDQKLIKTLFNVGPVLPTEIVNTIDLLTRGKFVKFGELPSETLAKILQGENAKVEPRRLHKGRGGDVTALSPFQRQSPAEQAKTRARLAALERDRKRKVVRPADTNAPNLLEAAQLDAQIKGDLAAELDADKKIEAYFRERKKLAKRGTERYNEILGAETSAHNATQSVLDQMAANDKAAASAAKASRDKAKADKEKAAADAAQAAKDLFSLQRSRFDLAIQRAVLSDSPAKIRSAYQAAIKFLEGKIQVLRKLKHLTIAQQQEIVDLTSAVVGYRSSLKGLSNASGSGGGLTAEGLFGEAISSFRSFGSNIGTGFSGILSPQDVRGQLAGQLIKNAPADKLASVMAQFGQTSTTIASAQLAEQQRTNRLLGIIAGVNAGTGKQFGYRGARVLGLEGKYAPGNENPWRGN